MFFEHVRFQARSRPKAFALASARTLVTYEELVARSLGMARYLGASGLGRGDILALNMQEPVAHCCAAIGAMIAGIPTLSAVGSSRLPKSVALAATLSDQTGPSARLGGKLLVAPTWSKEQPAGVQGIPVLAEREHEAETVRIICTAGTSGEHKAVPFTESQLIDRARSQLAGLRSVAGPTKSVSLMGLGSGAGFANMMLVLMTGGTLTLARGIPQLARMPNLQQMDRIVLSTAQLIAMVRHEENESADFAGIKSLTVGGSHIPRSIIRRARAICRNITCLYGSTEIGIIATAPAEMLIKQRSSVGYVIPGVSVQIVDEQDNPLGFDREGIIRVKVANAPTRYLNNEDATQSAFRDGWFYPGDIGSLSVDGLLYVLGGVSERIGSGGAKVQTNVIEDVIGSRPEIADVAAFEFVNAEGVSEVAVAIVPHESLDHSNFKRMELRQHFRKELGEKTPKRWLIVKEIPRNEQGKIDRARLKEIARNRVSLAA